MFAIAESDERNGGTETTQDEDTYSLCIAFNRDGKDI
jgi:hypothetical protein